MLRTKMHGLACLGKLWHLRIREWRTFPVMSDENHRSVLPRESTLLPFSKEQYTNPSDRT